MFGRLDGHVRAVRGGPCSSVKLTNHAPAGEKPTVGTWTAFYVEHASVDEVVSHCIHWMEDHRRLWAKLTRQRPQARLGTIPEDFWRWRNFRLRGGPDRLVVFCTSPAWITVMHNSFLSPNLLAAAVSLACRCRVVETQGQTTSDAYLTEVYVAGTCIRSLSFAADAGWLRNEGLPDAHEPQPLESQDVDEEGPGWFDAEAVERYLKQVFGIEWWQVPTPGPLVTVIE